MLKSREKTAEKLKAINDPEYGTVLFISGFVSWILIRGRRTCRTGEFKTKCRLYWLGL